MTMSLLSAEALTAGSLYGLPEEQVVTYTYWPVVYFLGDARVISSVSLPLSGVTFSEIMKGVGELKASLQLADPDVRALDPWSKIVPRKTGIVAIRSVRDDDSDIETHDIVWQGQVWSAPCDDATGRMEITARTIEYGWSRRLITGPMAGGDLVWHQQDRTTIAADLLTPERFSQIGPPLYYGSATALIDSGTPNYLVSADTDAGDIAVGDYVQILTAVGVPRLAADGSGNVFRVSAKNPPVGGQQAILYTPLTVSITQAGDVMRSVDLFPGWVNVDKPTVLTGQLHDFSYKRDQQTNLLEAHQDRSNVGDGYEWFTTTRVLEGANAYDAVSFRSQFVMGYPRLGRVYGQDNIPRFSYYTSGRGNVLKATPIYDGSGVSNVMWGQGAGYDSEALRSLVTNMADWRNGFLITEGRYSNPDVSRSDTLESYTKAALIQTYANERFLKAVTVRGDQLPFFGSYGLGDDALYTSDGWGNPDGPDGDREHTTVSRIVGWVVTPPQADHAEMVDLVLASGGEAGTESG